jgi:hypothetical protein
MVMFGSQGFDSTSSRWNLLEVWHFPVVFVRWHESFHPLDLSGAVTDVCCKFGLNLGSILSV